MVFLTGGTVDGDRLAVIRARNAAFDRLQQAVLACERRRHTTGSVPPTWEARLVDLDAAYRAALADCARAAGRALHSELVVTANTWRVTGEPCTIKGHKSHVLGVLGAERGAAVGGAADAAEAAAVWPMGAELCTGAGAAAGAALAACASQ